MEAGVGLPIPFAPVASFTYERHVSAPIETVFAVLTEHHLYAEITPMRKSILEREGEPPPNGVGAIRVLTSAGPPLREEVIAYEPPTRFSYKLLSGAPLRDHVGTVELMPQGGGTRVVYAVRTMPTLPLVGGAVVAVVKQGIKALLGGIVKESERRAANG
jgi:uncharacterized protein YndB with AHSA1/START domain